MPMQSIASWGRLKTATCSTDGRGWMCGINGWVSPGTPVERRQFDAMTDALAHRGPDGRGTAYFRNDRIALGHRRLAIQDLSSAGAQPMMLGTEGTDTHLALTFNGEIFNHPELRRELEAHGAVYRTACDAETILHGYRRWGPDVVHRLRGIFAFAIWDERQGQLFAARDHVGVKPFYIAQIGDALAFASQPCAFRTLSAFDGNVDPRGFGDALRHGMPVAGRSIYENVTRLPPAHCFIWRAGERRTWQYWSVPEEAEIGDATHARKALEELLVDSIGAQMLGDVPIHSLLSGGIDSSLTTAIAAENRKRMGQAFTLGFADPQFDESEFAKTAARAIGCDHTVRVMDQHDAETAFNRTIEAFDEPYGIDSGLPMVAISDHMAEAGVKVVLSGDGADELFAGYRHYDALAAHYARHARGTGLSPAASFLGRLRGMFGGGFSPFPTYTAHNGWFDDDAVEALSGPRLAAIDEPPFRREREVFDLSRGAVDAARRADFVSYLPDEILVKTDRATMAAGIEARVPLLDHRLVELAFRIEPQLHYDRGQRKALLKQAAAGWLPPSVLTARKKGFSAPVADFFLSQPGDEARILRQIASGPLVEDGWIDPSAIRRCIAKASYRAGAVLQLTLLDRWYRHWIRGGGTF